MTKEVQGEVIPKTKFNPNKKFKSSFCEEIIEFSLNGKNPKLFCVKNNISLSCIDRWKEKYPEFKEAYELAEEAYKLWWIEQGKFYAFNPEEKVNEKIFSKMIDVVLAKELKQSSQNTQPINVNINNQLPELTDEERQRRIEQLQQKLITDATNNNSNNTSS